MLLEVLFIFRFTAVEVEFDVECDVEFEVELLVSSAHSKNVQQGFVRYHKTTNVTIHNTTFLSLRRRIPYNDTIVVYNWCYNSQKLVKHKGKSG